MRESRYNIWEQFGSTHYLFNAASGAFRCASAENRTSLERFLAKRAGAPCPLPFLLGLCGDGMLVADEHDEVDRLRLRYAQGVAAPGHLTLTLLTSSSCNFACPYCFEAKHPSVMGVEVQRSILRYVDARVPALKVLQVTWFGGEPLLGQQPLFALSAALMDRCLRAGVQYEAGIITNGYLLDEVTCRRLAGHGVKTAQVTIDGPPDVHDRLRPLAGGQGTFWQIVKNLRHAVEYLQVVVRVNIDASTYDRASELLEILVAQGLAGRLAVHLGQIRWDEAAATPAGRCSEQCFSRRDFVRVAADFATLAEASGFEARSLPEPVALHCSALHRGDLVVGSEGELYRCAGLAGNTGEVIGDIRNYRWPQMGGAAFDDYDPFADAECRDCVALPVCMGGCPHDAVSPDPLIRANRCHEFRYSHHEVISGHAGAQEAKLRLA